MRGRSRTPKPFPAVVPPAASPTERTGRFAAVRRVPTPPPGSGSMRLPREPEVPEPRRTSRVVPRGEHTRTTPTTLLPPPPDEPLPDDAPGTITEAVTRALASMREEGLRLRASTPELPEERVADPKPPLVSLPPPPPSFEHAPQRPSAARMHESWVALLATLRRAGVIIVPSEHAPTLLEAPATRAAIATLLDTHVASSGDGELRDARMLEERIVDTSARKLYLPEVLVARMQHAVDEPLSVVMRAGSAELWLGTAMLSIRRVANHARRAVVRPASAQAIDAMTFVRAVNRLCAQRALLTRLVPVAASPWRSRYLRADARIAAELAAAEVCTLADARERAELCAW